MELTINNITKQYGNVTVLDDVSYRFTPGIYGILGANGAGKTTLFRFIRGIYITIIAGANDKNRGR